MEVKYYITEDGREPVVEWLKGLKGSRERGVVRARISRLQLGNPGDSKSVGDGIWELRVDTGPGYRVYYARSGNVTMLLLCGGSKKSQNSDIALAKEYWTKYKSRIAKEEGKAK